MNRATKAWEEYRLVMYGADTLPQTQERECSLAFYSGMMAAFKEVSEIAAVAADEDSGAQELEKLRKEIDFAAARANLDRNKGTS